MIASATLQDALPQRVHSGIKYLFRSNKKRRVIFIGGILVFSQNVSTELIFTALMSEYRTKLIVAGPVLLIILLLANSLLVGYYIRFLDHVIARNKHPPDFSKPSQLLRDGLITSAVSFGAYLLIFFPIGFMIGIIPKQIFSSVPGPMKRYLLSILPFIIVVYTTPALLLTMVRIQRREIGLRLYPRFIIESLYELSSIATKRNYVYGWILVGLLLLTLRLFRRIPFLRASEMTSDLVSLLFNFSGLAQMLTIALKFILSVSASIGVFYLMTVIYYIFADLMRGLVGTSQAELSEFR